MWSADAVQRTDNWFTRQLPSRIANWLMSKIARVEIHDFSTTFKAYRHEIIKNIQLYGELHRFIPALASGLGATIVEIPVEQASSQREVEIWSLILESSWTSLASSFSLIIPLGLSSFLAVGFNHHRLRCRSGILSFSESGSRAVHYASAWAIFLSMLLLLGGFSSDHRTGRRDAFPAYYESQNKPIYNVSEVMAAPRKRWRTNFQCEDHSRSAEMKCRWRFALLLDLQLLSVFIKGFLA